MPPTSSPATSELPRYDLDDAALTATCRDVLAAGRRRRNGFVCVGAGPDSALAQVARTLECRIFDEEYGNDAAEMAAEYGPYERASRFFVVIDVRRARPAGVVRVIHARRPEDRLKSVEDVASATPFSADDYLAVLGEPDFTSTMDIATLAIPALYRGSTSGSYQVGKLLYRSLIRHIADGRVQHVVMILDRRARRSLEYIGLPLIDVLGGPFDYLGSPESYAMRMSDADSRPTFERHSRTLVRQAGSRLVGLKPIGGIVRDLALARFTRALAHGGSVDRRIAM